jgi:hypothetical protein
MIWNMLSFSFSVNDRMISFMRAYMPTPLRHARL